MKRSLRALFVRSMGFVLQDRELYFFAGCFFANALAPAQRPFHTIIPAVMER